jgi:hypothetical protein
MEVGSASRRNRFTFREKAPSTHWIGGWVDARASQNDMEERKISFHYQKLNPNSVIEPVAKVLR